MITNDEIKVPEELKGRIISMRTDKIKIPYTANTMVIHHITDIMDKEYSGTCLGFYNKEGNCRGADRVNMNIVEFCEVIEEYFKS